MKKSECIIKNIKTKGGGGNLWEHMSNSAGVNSQLQRRLLKTLQTSYRYDPEIQLGSSHDPFLQAEICFMEEAAQESTGWDG